MHSPYQKMETKISYNILRAPPGSFPTIAASKVFNIQYMVNSCRPSNKRALYNTKPTTGWHQALIKQNCS